MAALSEDEIVIQPEQGVVEKRYARRKDRSVPYALALAALFILTCLVVFFGEKWGLRSAAIPATVTTAEHAQ